MHDGGTRRRDVVSSLISKWGGTMESFYFGFGDADVYVIFDLPDVTAAAALSLAVNASGAVRLKTIPLITVAEMDKAAQSQVVYVAPGAS